MINPGGLRLKTLGARLAAALLAGGLIVTPPAQAASKRHHTASAKKSSSHAKTASRKKDKHQRHAAVSRRSRQPVRTARAPSRPAPRYAAILMDARNREVLYAQAADEVRHPASITKVMTLYLTFEALSAGKLHLDDRVVFSPHAAAQSPSKLGVRPGDSISVNEAIEAMTTLSANDAAVAMAEKLGGTESRFAALMTLRAQELGMQNTHFANANGLPDSRQLTTARDIAILSRAVETLRLSGRPLALAKWVLAMPSSRARRVIDRKSVV